MGKDFFRLDVLSVTDEAGKGMDLPLLVWLKNRKISPIRVGKNPTADDRIRTVIQGGGVAIGKSAAMPPNPDLTQEQIQGLVSFVRSLAAH